MASVIALDEYRQRKNPQEHLETMLYPRPTINDGEIFARDYSRLEGIVFAILKVREILRYYITSNEEWQYLILQLLDAAYHFTPEKVTLLRESTGSLKDYILEEMDADSGKDLTSALLLVDLIEKSPKFRERVPKKMPPI